MSSYINIFLVFAEGILSFFSPCVIPVIPVYIAYLAGSNNDALEHHNRKKLLINTFCFVLGISFSFFILGLSFSTLGVYFGKHKLLFTRIGGIIIIAFGLFQLGIFDLKFLRREKKFHLDLKNLNVTPFIALLMGFTFSFAWTPCVGPALSSVLILASGAKSHLIGNFLVLIYTTGFALPFLFLGIFTNKALSFLNKHGNFIKYSAKIGGIILVIIGIMTYTGWMNGLSTYLNTPNSSDDVDSSENNSEIIIENDTTNNDSMELPGNKQLPATDFILYDQYGNKHKLSDYKGKVVFLNFWATWCPPCRREIPDIEKLYKKYDENSGEVIILGITNPSSKEYPYNQDVEDVDVVKFLEENNITFPVVFDKTGEVFASYNINSFPTTIMIDKNGNITGYSPGMLTKDIMESIIKETLSN